MVTGNSQDSIPRLGGPFHDEPAARNPAPAPPAGRRGWTAGRVIALVAGSVLALVSLGLLAGGGTLTWADQTQRQDGYLMTGTAVYSTRGYALASGRITLNSAWRFLEPLVGQARIRVTPVGQAKPVFIAVGATDKVSRFLSGSSYTTINGWAGGGTSHRGTAVPGRPAAAGIWAARASGAGTPTLRWTPDTGDWTIVAMNADGSAGLTVRASAGMSVPFLLQLAIEMLVAGVLLAALSAALIVVPVRLAATSVRSASGSPPEGKPDMKANED